MNKKEVKAKVAKINDDDLLSPRAITDIGLLLDTTGNPSLHVVYRLIKRGDLETVGAGASENTKLVTGKSFKALVVKRYGLDV